VADACSASGILPFGTGYSSDHRAVYIKINMESVLQSTISSIETRRARKLQQATPRERHIFIEKLNKHYESQNLYERLQDLAEIPAEEWTLEHQLEYEKCDKQHIDGMLAAEK
jgi:hypothetical protein